MRTKVYIKRCVLCWGLFFLGMNMAYTQQINWSNNGLLHIDASVKIVSKGNFENKSDGVFVNNGEVIFKKDVINHGYFSFHDGEFGYVRMEGEEEQNIRGTRPILFFDLSIDNSSNVLIPIYNDVEIYGKTYFNRGIFQTRETGGQISFQSLATVQSANNLSFIDGYVTKLGKQNMVLPIGHQGYYRGVRIFGNIDEEDNYKAIYHKENSDAYFSHASKQEGIAFINEEEYWELVDYKTSNHVYIQLYLSEETTPSVFLDNLDQACIVAWDAQQEKWILIESLVDTSNNTITSVFKVATYGVYTLALKESETDEVDIEFFNAVNPKDIHGNQYFKIKGIHQYPDNELKIYNRWGALVYETKAYDTQENVFNGISNGKITINKKKQLPEGTYFYVLKRRNSKDGKQLTNTGYLYLIR